MKTILYIGSLNTKKQQFDGERIKSTLIFEVLSKKYNVICINLSIHKLLNTFKIFYIGLFKKRKIDKAVISKDPHGANIILKILRLVRFPLDKIIYFEIGPFLYDRVLNGSIKKSTFDNIKIVVETSSMRDELSSIGYSNISIFPNFKKSYQIIPAKKEYPQDLLKLVYFSRIDEVKGIFDLMKVVDEINKDRLLFTLDIYGKFSINFNKALFESYLNNGKNGISYKGKMILDNCKQYQILNSYDLHVFPTKYSEGFPGTIIDFFVAGVPTLSSTFARAYDILNDDDSFFFEKGNNDELKKKLLDIYNNQTQLLSKRIKCFERKDEFSVETFENYISNII